MKTIIALTALLAPADAFRAGHATSVARVPATARAATDEMSEALDQALPNTDALDQALPNTDALDKALADGGEVLASGFVTSEAKQRAGWLDRVFGYADEDALKASSREGQSTWLNAINVAEADPFGLRDEAATKQAVLGREFAPDPFLLRGEPPLSGGVSGQVGVVDALGLEADGRVCVPTGAGAAAARPERVMSLALPFLARPPALDAVVGPIAGDAGFDPLGLATPENLGFMRDAELKHGRLAMLAALGWPVSEAVQPWLSKDLDLPSTVAQRGGLAPSVLNGGLDTVPVTFWIAAIGATIAIELTAMQRRAAGAAPGDLGFDPLNMNSESMAENELANGRLAMLAITGFAFQEFSTKLAGIPIPVIHQFPF